MGEIARDKAVLPALRKGILCLADRNFFGFALWQLAQGTSALRHAKPMPRIASPAQ